MKNYVSPVIFDNEELAEGVYATGSGGSDCWDVTVTPEGQPTTGSSDNFASYRVLCTHKKPDVYHVSYGLEVTVNFMSNNLKEIEIDGTYTQPGGQSLIKQGDSGFLVDQVTSFSAHFTRFYHGNAEQAGDKVDFLFKIKDADGLSGIVNWSYKCLKEDDVNHMASRFGDL